MQTAHAFRVVEMPRPPARRRGGGPVRLADQRPPAGKLEPPGAVRTARKPRGSSRGWVKPLVMAIIVAAEWLVLIAEAFVRVYFYC